MVVVIIVVVIIIIIIIIIIATLTLLLLSCEVYVMTLSCFSSISRQIQFIRRGSVRLSTRLVIMADHTVMTSNCRRECARLKVLLIYSLCLVLLVVSESIAS